jgi:antitoxin YefM
MLESSLKPEVDFMNAITLKEAKRNLEQVVEQVIADAEPTIVVAPNGDQVVFLSLDEYNSWKETLYLLANPANADHLRQSIAEAQAGKAQERELIEE